MGEMYAVTHRSIPREQKPRPSAGRKGPSPPVRHSASREVSPAIYVRTAVSPLLASCGMAYRPSFLPGLLLSLVNC